MDSKNKTIVSVLVLLAVILGVAVYFKYNPMPAKQPTPIVKNISNPSSANQISLTADEKTMFLNTPGPNASKAELDAYAAFVTKHSVAGNMITIKDCTASPDVLKIKEGDKFTVNNKGTTDIHFGFQDERIMVNAGSSAVITAKFKNGPGIYGYGCDDKTLNRSIGILMITP